MSKVLTRIQRNRVAQALWVLRALALGAKQHREIRRVTGLEHGLVVEALRRLHDLQLATEQLEPTPSGMAVLASVEPLAPEHQWTPHADPEPNLHPD